MADFMRVKYENPRLKQSEITNQLGDSTNTLGRNGNEIIMLSPCRVQSNNTKKTGKITDFDTSYRNPDPKRPQMTSNDLKKPRSTLNENGKK